jgi:hypothetical protein
MKNQPFHQRKIRIQGTPKLDFDQVKARTIAALNKLGQQRFSTEPGGYTLDNWTKVMNVLLDEFEEKAGPARLSPVYLAKRHELNDYLSKPVFTSPIDSEMSELKANISGIENKIESERARTTSRASELRGEEARLSADLERERRRVASAASVQNNGSFLNRLLGRPTPTKTSESRIKLIESKVSSLQNELLDLQKHLKTIDPRTPQSPFAEDWSRMESMQSRLKVLEEEKLDATQLVKERVGMTASIADAISRIS